MSGLLIASILIFLFRVNEEISFIPVNIRPISRHGKYILVIAIKQNQICPHLITLAALLANVVFAFSWTRLNKKVRSHCLTFTNLITYFLCFYTSCSCVLESLIMQTKQGLKGGFHLLVWASKPSETQVVHQSGHPTQYKRRPSLLNVSEQTSTHPTLRQSMEVRCSAK